ncbi:MAG: hypothetical protein WA416_12750 [Candidatus Sulfotelmatobacter sp.]
MPECRTPVMTMVEASWVDQSGALRSVPARMEDRSAGGACIRVKMPIGVGSKLRIQWRFEQFSGTAKYCRSEGREYLVGIQRDTTKDPLTSDPVPAEASTAKAESIPKQRESKPNEIPVAALKAATAPVSHTAPLAGASPTPGADHEMDDGEKRLASRLEEFNALRRNQFKTKQLPRRAQAGEERKSMRSNWFGLTPKGNQQDDLSSSGDPAGKANGKGEDHKENLMPPVAPPTKKAPAAREVPSFRVELSPMEDIYRAAGILLPRKGYSINKVVEMLNSEHIRGLSKEMKRVALLMALDAAGVAIDEVLRDAKARRDALDTYEALERKQIEAEWARKAEENIQIQAELESVRAHYTARIGRNLEGVAREKATFDSWVALKREECQSMAEAAELCLKSPAAEPPNASPSSGEIAQAASSAAAGAKPM